MAESTNPQTHKTLMENRHIRVFISSTFRDMMGEREELTKHIFPQLRKMCEQRGVVFTDVDLRWGINDEQKSEGQVLPICLAEINNCRPFFIGLLGERYGWVPDEIPQALIEKEKWLEEHKDKSVTELEILHGVLNNPEMANHTCFYFRDAAYINTLPESTRKDHISKTQKDRDKLAALKTQIKNSLFALRENYPDPKALGQMVLEDLTNAINQEFPPGTEPDLLDKEAAEHEAYAQSRKGVYIGRQTYFDRLDAHAASPGLPLTVLGESGLGKSALLANWALTYIERHPDELVLMHFIGASAYSANWAAMLRRIMGEFKRRFDIQQDIPDKPDELRMAFANWMSMAAVKGKVILVLDGLNQLEDKDNAPDLTWLPPFIPESIRLIVSTLPGRSLDELNKRNLPSLEVQPLDIKEREELIIQYLSQFRKTLASEQADRIAAAEQAQNPLFLRALLEELRLFGSYERLDNKINDYLTAMTVPQLYEKILTRYEHDYERDRPGLVKDAMCLIWAARRGLSESELLDMLGIEGESLPRSFWSPLYLAADQSLVSRSGLLTFSHNYLREAVNLKYLGTEDNRKQAHICVADYFQQQDLGVRKIDELPWQFTQAHSWRSLYDLLADLEFFAACWENDEYQTKTYWAQVENNSSWRKADAYKSIIDAPHCYGGSSLYIAKLLKDAGQYADAMKIYESDEFLCQELSKTNDKLIFSSDYKYLVSVSLGNQACVLIAWGRFEEAMELLKQQESLLRDLNDEFGIGTCLCNQALILYHWGRMKEAMELYKCQESISKKINDRCGLSSSLAGQALVMQAWGQLEEAMKLHKQEESLCKELGDESGLRKSLGNQAIILHNMGRLEEAMEIYKQQEGFYSKTDDKAELATTLCNQGAILKEWGQLEEAMDLYTQQEALTIELNDKSSLSTCLFNQALIHFEWGQLDQAMKLYKQQELLCKELKSKIGLSESLSKQALILQDWDQLEEALELYQKEESLRRAIGNTSELLTNLCNQSYVFERLGQLDAARRLYEQQEAVCKEIGDKSGLAISLYNQAVIFHKSNNLEAAMELYKQAEPLLSELRPATGLVKCLYHQGRILVAWNQLEEAMDLNKQLQAVSEELGDKLHLSASLDQQALILTVNGQYEDAMQLYKQSEILLNKLGEKSRLSNCLCSQAVLLKAGGQYDEALILYEQVEAIQNELDNKSGLLFVLVAQAELFYEQGRLVDAMEMYKKQVSLYTEQGDQAGLSECLCRQAVILRARHFYSKAINLYEQAEAIQSELGNSSGLLSILVAQAETFHESGQLADAWKMYKRQVPFYKELRDRLGLSGCLCKQAVILRLAKYDEDAMTLCKQAEAIQNELDNKFGLLLVLIIQAEILHGSAQLNETRDIYRRLELLLHELGDNKVELLESNTEIKEYSSFIRAKSVAVARELMAQQGLVFKFAESEEEARSICSGQVSRYYEDAEHELGSACLIQIGRFRHVIDVSGYVKDLCQLGDHYYYDKGDCEKALTCFQLAAGLNPESGEALHGAALVLWQGLCLYADALPYAVVADYMKPGRNVERYVREKLSDI